MEDYTNLEKQFRDTIKFIKEYLNLLNKNKEFIFKLEINENDEFENLEKEFKQNMKNLQILKDFQFQ